MAVRGTSEIVFGTPDTLRYILGLKWKVPGGCGGSGGGGGLHGGFSGLSHCRTVSALRAHHLEAQKLCQVSLTVPLYCHF